MLVTIARAQKETFTGGGEWLDQMGIRLTQLSTGLKVEAELGKNSGPLLPATDCNVGTRANELVPPRFS